MRFLTPGTASATPSAPVGFGDAAGNAAEGRARPDGDGGGGAAADLAGDVERRPAADRAIRAVGAGRNRALDDGDVAAGPSLTVVVQVLLGLVAGGGHDRLVVVDRQHVEDDLGRRRAAGPQEGLGVARAVLELEPDEHGLLRLLDRPRDLRRHAVGQRQRRRHRRAEAHELASRNPAPLELGRQPSMPFPHTHLAFSLGVTSARI